MYNKPSDTPEVEKAYKIIADQVRISNREAKLLIDRGLVYKGKEKVKIARAEYPLNTKFRIEHMAEAKVLFEDENLIAIDKPAFITSEEVVKKFKGAELLHRLDKETSGVMLLVKNEEFRKKAVEEFRQARVYKEYVAWVDGVLSEAQKIDKPILTIKGKVAKSKISYEGKEALTEVEPLEVSGKRTKVKAVITTGRTHQIRVHLSSIQHPLVGDTLYGGREHKRIMLHAKKITLFEQTFESVEPKDFDFTP